MDNFTEEHILSIIESNIKNMQSRDYALRSMIGFFKDLSGSDLAFMPEMYSLDFISKLLNLIFSLEGNNEN